MGMDGMEWYRFGIGIAGEWVVAHLWLVGGSARLGGLTVTDVPGKRRSNGRLGRRLIDWQFEHTFIVEQQPIRLDEISDDHMAGI